MQILQESSLPFYPHTPKKCPAVIPHHGRVCMCAVKNAERVCQEYTVPVGVTQGVKVIPAAQLK